MLIKKIGKTLGKGLTSIGKVGKAITKGVGGVTGFIDKNLLGGMGKEIISQTPLLQQGQQLYQAGKRLSDITTKTGRALEKGNVKEAYKSGRQGYETAMQQKPAFQQFQAGIRERIKPNPTLMIE